VAKTTTFSKKPYVERLAAVIETMQQLHKTQWLITQADIRKKLSVKDKTDMKSVERAVKDLVQLNILKESQENNCAHCGRPLGKGPFYSLTSLVPIGLTSKTYSGDHATIQIFSGNDQ